MRWPLLLGIALVAVCGWNCSQSPRLPDAGALEAGDAGDAGLDAGADGGADAGIGCGDPESSPEMDCGALAWTKSSVTSRLRNHQFSFVAQSDAGAFLYVLGGINYTTLFANADRAAIHADGSLDAFSATTPMKIAAAGLVGAVVGDVVVVAGGHAKLSVSDQSFSTLIQGDGSLGEWTPTGSILHPRMHGGAIVFGNTVYFIGGFDGISTVWSDVVSASVQPDGTLSPWTTAGELPQPWSHFGAARVGNHVFLSGGLDKSATGNPPVLTKVSRGTIAADGTLGDWTDMTALPVGIATHASFVYGGRLYIVGGVSGVPQQENRIWSVPVNADATLGAWQLEAPLPIRRAHVHQLPMFENHFYSVAGAIDFDLSSTSEVDIGTFE